MLQASRRSSRMRKILADAAMAARLFHAAMAAGFLLSPTIVMAHSPLSVTLGIGAQYDSNLSIEEADIPIRKGDEALLLSASVQLVPVDSKTTTLRFGYAFDEERNTDLTDVNLTIHGVSAGIARRVGKVMIGADYQFNHILLGGSRYLEMHTASPSASSFLSRNLFVRAALTWQRKDFITVDPLDAETTMLSLDGYRFFARRKGYIALGFRADSERTTAEQFRFDAVQVSARAQIPFKVGKAQWKARLGYSYQERDYLAPTPSIGKERHETRSTFSAGLEIPVIAKVTFRPQARYVDRRSNVAFYDYREHIISAQFLLKL